MKVIRRYWDNMFGWGDVISENDNFIIVRFDADPWVLRELPKETK